MFRNNERQSNRLLQVILLLLVVISCLWVAVFSQVISAAPSTEFVAVPLHANEQADYSAAPKKPFNQVSLDIIMSVLRDELPPGVDVAERVAVLMDQLKIPVPTVTPRPGDAGKEEEPRDSEPPSDEGSSNGGDTTSDTDEPTTPSDSPPADDDSPPPPEPPPPDVVYVPDPPEEPEPPEPPDDEPDDGGGSGNGNGGDPPPPPPSADLAVTKDDGATQYTPGDTVTYTIVVSNNGPNKAKDSVVSDNIPAQVTSWTWLCVAQTGNADGCDGVTNSTADFSDTVKLPSGTSITYSVTAITAPSATGDLVNTVHVTPPGGVTDPTTGNNSATDTNTTDNEADLAVTKDDGQTEYSPGTSITYTIVVSNNGPGDASGATVSDTRPTQLSSWTWACSAETGGANGCDGGSTANFTDTVNLPSGSSITYTVISNIVSGASGDLINTVNVSPPVGVNDNTPGNNSDTDTNDDTIHIEIVSPTNGQIITDRSETTFEAEAWIGNVRQNGNGISRIEFRIPETGYTNTENIVRYCAFGGDAPCQTMTQTQWDNLIDGNTYTLEARACQQTTGDCSTWDSVNFVIDKP
jgi:uncharacterized repeat protein (TIGR01451 family)